VVSTYGTKQSPPVALDDTTITATTALSWGGHSEERAVDIQIVERTRRFSLVLASNGEPGYRSEQITLKHKDKVLAGYSFQWEVPRLLKAVPSTIIVSPSSGNAEKTVVLRSTDSRNFRVTRVETDMEGIRAECEDRGLSSVKSIRIAVNAQRLKTNRSSEITIHTDHPLQPMARVLVVISSGSG
jgi:hypothetical protein